MPGDLIVDDADACLNNSQLSESWRPKLSYVFLGKNVAWNPENEATGYRVATSAVFKDSRLFTKDGTPWREVFQKPITNMISNELNYMQAYLINLEQM